MNLKTLAGALVVLLLATSGCLSPPPQETPGDGNETGLPPGVTAEGVVNHTELFDAHAAELRGTAYTMNATESFRINDTRRVIKVTQQFPAEPNGTVYVNKTQADDGTITLVLNRWGPDDEGLYYLREFTPQSVNVTYGASQDRSYLGLRDYTTEVRSVVTESDEGNQSVRKVDGEWRIGIDRPGSNISLHVNESGFIHQFVLDDEAALNHTFTLTYTRIGAVGRPAWIDRARESIGFSDAQNKSDGNTST